MMLLKSCPKIEIRSVDFFQALLGIAKTKIRENFSALDKIKVHFPGPTIGDRQTFQIVVSLNSHLVPNDL